jgi:hypothetical protein
MVEEQVRVLQPLHIVIAAETVARRAGASATIVSTPAVVRFIFKEEGGKRLYIRVNFLRAARFHSPQSRYLLRAPLSAVPAVRVVRFGLKL